MSDLNTKNALCVYLPEAICIACAEQIYNAGDYINLFWIFNKPRLCKADLICSKCKKQMDNEKTLEATGRIAAMFGVETRRSIIQSDEKGDAR